MKEESLLLLSDLQKLINQVVLIDYTIIILGDGKHVSKNAGFIYAVAQQYFVIYEGKKIIHRYKGK